MRPTRFILLLLLAGAGTGCSFTQASRRNMTHEPVYAVSAKTARMRYEKLAREAFRLMAGEFPDQEFSCEYRCGFVDGFCDYIEFGGSCEPPPVPPPEFRQVGYMTPAGLLAQQDWFGGFRHGAATAKASGLRDLVKVQVYLPPNPNPPRIVNPPRKVTEPGDAPLAPPKVLDSATPTTPAAPPATGATPVPEGTPAPVPPPVPPPAPPANPPGPMDPNPK